MNTVPIDGPTFPPMCPRAPCNLDVFIHVKFQKRAKTRWMNHRSFSLHFLITPIPIAGIFQGQESFLPTFINAFIVQKKYFRQVAQGAGLPPFIWGFPYTVSTENCLPKEED